MNMFRQTVADPEIVGGGGCSRSRAAEGREGVGRGTPSPGERGLWRGLCPIPRIFFSILDLKMASFGALCVLVGGMHPPHPPPGSATAGAKRYLMHFGLKNASGKSNFKNIFMKNIDIKIKLLLPEPFFLLKMHQIPFGGRTLPGTAGGAYSAPRSPIAGLIKGAYF